MMVMVHARTSIPTAKTLIRLLSGGNLSYTDFPVAILWMANKMNHSEFLMFKMFFAYFVTNTHQRSVIRIMIVLIASRG